MSYASIQYLIIIIIISSVYFCIPVKYRWYALLCSSIAIYYYIAGINTVWPMAGCLVAWGAGILIRKKIYPRLTLMVSICLNLGMLFGIKGSSVFAPIGISFYTLMLIGYVVDVYQGKTEYQPNLLKLLLFTSFFPYVIQGPVGRYNQLEGQLYEGHSFEYKRYCHGFQLILWGMMEKLIIADRISMLVNTVYLADGELKGIYVVLAFLMYSFQLYADFDGCVNIARGTAQLFGINLMDNFKQPYFASSVQDFWRRWHISLSQWLRDYVYIPLGGNKKGSIRKYCNILMVFLVSGIWHGSGITFMVWGLLHGILVAADNIIRKLVNIKNPFLNLLRRVLTFITVTFLWGLFRAESLAQYKHLIKAMLRENNFWGVLCDADRFQLSGIRIETWISVLVAIVVMLIVDVCHERSINIRDYIDQKPLVLRWTIYIGAILTLLIWGVYGPGYSASQFIYGQF